MASAESQAFKKKFSTLVSAIDNPLAVAVEAYSRDLVSKDILDRILVQTLTASEKATVLLCCIGSRISACQSSFHEFVRVLKTQTNLIEVAETLQMEFWKCQEEQTPPTRNMESLIQAAPHPATKQRRLGGDEIDTQGPMQTAPQPAAKRRRLDGDQVETQGMQQICVHSEAMPPAEMNKGEFDGIQQSSDCLIQTATQPVVKRRKLGDYEMDAQGIQQVCVQREAVPPPEENRGDFGGIQRSSVCPMHHAPQPAAKRRRLDDDQVYTQGTTYQSYCSNIHDVYRGAPFKESNSWPPMGRVKYINLAILKSEKLTVSDDYTLMTIQRSADDIVSKKKRIGYVKLFDGLESGSKVLVEGRPGCGKTTLLNRISLDWASGKILKGIELLILVPLRRFHSKAEVELDDMLQLYDTGHLCHSVGNQISLSGGKGVCIVLDGLDEYPRCSEPGNFVLELLKGSKLPSSVVIASSRPAAAHHFRQHATQRVEVLGFLRPEIQQYVQEHYEQDNDKLKALNTYLEHHPNIRHMCYLPLHLAMVVYLNDVLESVSLPHTETGVYDKFMLYTLLRDMRRGSQSSKEQLSDVKQLHPEKLKVFRNICSLAFSATVQSEQIFSRKDVEGVLGSTEFSLESLGLLTEDKLFCEHGLEETYSFAHLTFQEFLAAYHLTELPAAEQIEAVREHVGKKHMGVVWKFYCGITQLTGNVAMDVFRVLLQLDEFNLLLLVHSIHESQNLVACCELISSRNGVLSFTDEVLTSADMLAVAYCLRNASTSLTELSFQSCYLDREELQVLTSECSYPLMNITCLSLKKTLIRKKVVSAFVTFLGRFPNLESLEFPRFSRPPSAGDLAVVFSSLKGLKSLIADSVVIRSRGGILQLLKTIATLQTIRCCGSSLDLEVPKEFDKGAPVRVFKGKKRTTLLSVQKSATYDLELSAKPMGRPVLHEADIHVLAELFQLCPRVQRIKLYGNRIGDEGCAALSRGLQECKELQELDLSLNNIGDEGCATLSRSLKECRELKELSLSLNKFGVEGCAALSRGLKECRELKVLGLVHCSIGDSGAIALAESLRSCTSLQKLILSGCSIGDSGAIALAESLRSCTSLQKLDLSFNVFGDEGVAALSRGLKECRELKALDLNGCSIGNSGAIALAESLRSCTSLQELNLGHCSTGDSGAIALAESLRSCTSLQELNLRDNSLTDASIKSISEVITTVKSLKGLDLFGNKFTEGGEAQLQQAAQDRKSYPDFVELGLSV